MRTSIAHTRTHTHARAHTHTHTHTLTHTHTHIQALHYPTYRESGDGDCWDGSLLRNWTRQQMLDVLALSFSSDAAVLQMWKKYSFTPVVAQLLSLPPHLRCTFHGTSLPPQKRIPNTYINIIFFYIYHLIIFIGCLRSI